MPSRADGAARSTQIEGGLIARITGALKLVTTGRVPDDFFGPGTPVAPQAQEQAVGRQFDFPVGTNIQTQPRSGENVTFAQLRALADAHDVTRLVLETRKDQMSKLQWTVKKKDGTDDTPQATKIKDFLRYPDKINTWNTWLRMALEDAMVLDAPCIYKRVTNGGELYALELIDGATIKRVLSPDGRTPLAPAPAYQQVLKGIPAVDYTTDDLIYAARNLRTHKAYGYGPIEQIIMTVNIALRRQVHQLSYYTEGNIPEMLISTPTTWQVDMIEKFQKYWDLLMSGDLAKRRHAKFIPGDMKVQPTHTEKLFDEADEWLARIVCFAFSISPQPFIKQMNRATATSAQEVALEEGLAPLMLWVKDTMDRIIEQWMGAPDHEFVWGDEQDVDPLVQAQIDQIYVNAGVDTPNEIRDRRGLGPIEGGDKPRAPIAAPNVNEPPAPGDEPDKMSPGEKQGNAATQKLAAAALSKRRSLRLY